MSVVHNNFRFLKTATISLIAVIVIVGCTNQAYSVNNPDSGKETREQLNENLQDNSNESMVEVPHVEEYIDENKINESRRLENVDLHDMEVEGSGHEVREFENNNLDEISLQSSYVSDPIITPDHCYYTAKRNVNCRVSDYIESTLIAILMQGEDAKLLYLNPTFTHGKFELLNNSQCWIALGLMRGPSDPYKMCQVYVVDAPPSRESSNPDEPNSPVCSLGLDEPSCLAAGGSWVAGGAVGASYCNCG